MQKYPIIRKIYLYVFALAGLFMVTVGSARLVTLGLKTYVLTKADDFYDYPQPRPLKPEIAGADKTDSVEPSKEEVDLYKKNQRTANRQREAAESLGWIIVGLPLYLYHWFTIQRDKKQES